VRARVPPNRSLRRTRDLRKRARDVTAVSPRPAEPPARPVADSPVRPARIRRRRGHHEVPEGGGAREAQEGAAGGEASRARRGIRPRRSDDDEGRSHRDGAPNERRRRRRRRRRPIPSPVRGRERRHARRPRGYQRPRGYRRRARARALRRRRLGARGRGARPSPRIQVRAHRVVDGPASCAPGWKDDVRGRNARAQTPGPVRGVRDGRRDTRQGGESPTSHRARGGWYDPCSPRRVQVAEQDAISGAARSTRSSRRVGGRRREGKGKGGTNEEGTIQRTRTRPPRRPAVAAEDQERAASVVGRGGSLGVFAGGSRTRTRRRRPDAAVAEGGAVRVPA